jgi:hypothetical protein
MRAFLFFLAVTASAQDNRGFVNSRLVTQNFVKNSLRPAPPARILVSPPAKCAIPLLEVPMRKHIDRGMVVPSDPTVDRGMILPTLPVCR